MNLDLITRSQTITKRANFKGMRRPGLKFAALNFSIVVLGYLAVVEPALDAIGNGAVVVAEKQDKLTRYRDVAAQAAAVETFAKKVLAGSGAHFIAGESDGMVAANLQARLKALADDAKVSVISVQMLPSKSFGDLTLFGARLEIVGRIGSVHALARNIESGAPVLVISDADLRKEAPMTAGAESNLGIEARLDVFGAASPAMKSGESAETHDTKGVGD